MFSGIGARRPASPIALLAVLCGSMAMAGESRLLGVDLRAHISGPEVTAEDLVAKVVLVEYGGFY